MHVPDSVAEIARTHQAFLESRGVRTTHGAFYTPIPAAQRVVDIALAERIARIHDRNDVPTVIDPACGTGNFLVVAALRLAERLVEVDVPFGDAIAYVVSTCIHGIDIDSDAVALCRRQLSALTNGAVGPEVLAANIRIGNTLTDRATLPRFDVVIGNPPFLDRQSRRTGANRGEQRAITASFGDGATAINSLTNTAAVFLLAGLDLAKPDGVVAMIQPVSFLTARDSAGVRNELAGAGSIGIWMTRERVFDAAVHVCAVVVDRAATDDHVRVLIDGIDDVALDPSLIREPTWAFASACLEGVPSVRVENGRVLGDLCDVTADFRDQYYGIVGHVHENAEPEQDGMRLVTSGLIEPFRCEWGIRRTRFAKSPYLHPVVRPSNLPTKMREWARVRAVPKVLVATQTKTIEAVADPGGRMLPSVPVLSAIPHNPDDIWLVLAALMSPVASLAAAHRHLGAGLSPGSLKLSASNAARLPLPIDDAKWNEGAQLARTIHDGESDDLELFGATMCAAHGLDPIDTSVAMDWWLPRVSR